MPLPHKTRPQIFDMGRNSVIYLKHRVQKTGENDGLKRAKQSLSEFRRYAPYIENEHDQALGKEIMRVCNFVIQDLEKKATQKTYMHKRAMLMSMLDKIHRAIPDFKD